MFYGGELTSTGPFTGHDGALGGPGLGSTVEISHFLVVQVGNGFLV